MYIVKKKIGKGEYYYLRKSQRVKGKVKSKSVAYLGKDLKEAEKKAREIESKVDRKVSTDEAKDLIIQKKKKESMGEKTSDEFETGETKEFLSFVREGGLIWGPEPEIYGGMAGFYTYGPLGKLLKNKVENSVRRVFNTFGFRELEGPTVMPDNVWEASGHLKTFKDRIIKCKNCESVFRADKLIEEKFDVAADAFSDKKLLDFIKEKDIKCPSCKGGFEMKIEAQSLMMKTEVAGEEASLRPETATVTYLPYLNFYNYFRKKLPFGVFQIGKAYRNEISPRQSVLRGREFTQAEGQIFVDPEEKNNWEGFEEIKKENLPFWDHKAQEKDYERKEFSVEDALKKGLIKSQAYGWCIYLAYMHFINFGIPKEKIRLRQHHPDEKAFYADDAWDVEIQLNNYGWTEVCGVHDRTDYDLTQHGKASGEKLEAQRENGESFVPHVLEIAFGTDRPTYALIDLFYEKKGEEEGKTVFAIPYHMAPIDVSVFPLMKKPELVKLAKDVQLELERDFIVVYDGSGSIGRRYLRSATAGTPFAVTVDYDSLEGNDVTIRDRDSEKQVRVKVRDLRDVLDKLIKGEVLVDDIGKEVDTRKK
ncbi:glycine--tRNA ligase [Candidatus Pacearchaeota archaeon]|nr:glycine--tRNA ligase [Candidatus Pacearchaeota archaeon]|tara:strand:+ start:7935 stop:9707 length:1773 start_codon:yes stop_codon:yes gene_type:complete